MTVTSFGLGAWALLGVVRAIALADRVAGGGAVPPGAVWAGAMLWLGPALLAGLVLVLAVSRPGADLDPYLARNVRLGVLVALFALLLAWSLVLFAAHVSRLAVGRGAALLLIR